MTESPSGLVNDFNRFSKTVELRFQWLVYGDPVHPDYLQTTCDSKSLLYFQGAKGTTQPGTLACQRSNGSRPARAAGTGLIVLPTSDRVDTDSTQRRRPRRKP